MQTLLRLNRTNICFIISSSQMKRTCMSASRANANETEQSRAEQYTAMQCNGHSALKAARWLSIARAPAYHCGGQLFGTCSKREVVFCTSNQICEMLPSHQRTERLLHQLTPNNISFSAGCMFMRGDITVGKHKCVRMKMQAAFCVVQKPPNRTSAWILLSRELQDCNTMIAQGRFPRSSYISSPASCA